MKFMYNYSYNTSASSASGLGFGYWMFMLIFAAAGVVAMWKIFTKAGEEGWKALIPIYDLVILFKISGLSPWLILVMLIPIGTIVILIMLYIKLAKAFGKSGGFAAGLILLNTIFMLILAFDSSKYVGPQE